MSKITCSNCEKEILEKPSKEFLGFQKYKCLSCKKETLYPLFDGYRTTYWIILIISIIIVITSLANGSFPIPGWLSVFAIYILIKDRILKKKRDKKIKVVENQTDKKEHLKLKKIGVIIAGVVLLFTAYILGTKNSKINDDAEVSNRTLLEECLKQTESINPDDDFYKALDAISECDKKYGDNNY